MGDVYRVHDPATRRVLSVQGVSEEGEAAKRIDVAAQLILGEGTIEDFLDVEHAYAPPYAPALDPLTVHAILPLRYFGRVEVATVGGININQAIMAAWQAGIVVVASAGNGGPDPMTIGVPGNCPYVITAGGMSDNFTPADDADDFSFRCACRTAWMACRRATRDLDGDGRTDQYGISLTQWLQAVVPWIWQAGGELLDERGILAGEVVKLRAVCGHVVQLPRLSGLLDELPLAAPHGPVVLVFPV